MEHSCTRPTDTPVPWQPTTGGHHHDALLYDDSDDLYTAVLAALDQEAGGDDLIVLACQRQHNEALAVTIAATLPGLATTPVSRPAVGRRPAATLAAQRRLLCRHDRRPDGRIWYIAEPDPGTTRRTWTETTRYEAAGTITLAGLPLTTVCAYPAAATPAVLRDAVLRTHPRLITATGPAANPASGDPALVLAAASRPVPLPEPARPPVLHVVGEPTIPDLGGIRGRLTEALAGLPTLVRTDFVAAVNEILTNACLHAAPPVEVTVWLTDDQAECRVTDRGDGFHDPLAGYLPEPGGNRTRTGLWLARQVCDHLDTWRTAGRFTVRLATTITPDQALDTNGALARAETARARVALAHRRHAAATHRYPGR